MELALIILVVGVVYYINKDSGINGVDIKKLAKQLDKELAKAFKERDDKIKALQDEIERLKNKND